MTTFKLAYRNLMGAGLRTWLNVFVLALVYIMMIWFKGMISGWDQQAKHDMIAWELGGGQLWHKNYDPYDLFTLNESHAKISPEFQKEIEKKTMTPLLIAQGTLYPEGRIQAVKIKGIKTNQNIIHLPTDKLKSENDEIQALIGKRMAKSCDLKEGDAVVIRWRDKNGTFDATEIRIASVFDCNVPSIDNGNVWISIENMQKMLQLENEVTMFILNKNNEKQFNSENFEYKSQKFLLSDIEKLIATKSMGGSVFSFILLLMGLLAIFDTQVLSIFRRQKEIGTFVALGMTRGEVVRLFTLEGAMNAVLAGLLAAVLGTPLFLQQMKNGITLPGGTDDYGIAMTDVMYPVYGVGLIFSTIVIVLISTTIVSYLPARKISKMNPTDAIRGKLQ